MKGVKIIILLKIISLLGIQFFFNNYLSGQNTIYLKNPSFEDIPRIGGLNSIPIHGWIDCGLTNFPDKTPPDIHPVPGNAWKVSKKAYHGNTYIGLVVRRDSSYESVSQTLEYPINGGICYSFSAYLTRSEVFQARILGSVADCSSPVIMKIWGGNDQCQHGEVLATSSLVENTEWKLYEFNFQPHSNYSFITIEAYFANTEKPAYNGHILVDRLSPIIEIECK